MSEGTVSNEFLIQDQILEGAKRLFSKRGLGNVTMEDVAKSIGKTRGSVYYYYKNKYEILDAVILRELRDVKMAIENAVNQANTTEDRLNAFFNVKLKIGREKHILFDMLESEIEPDAISNFNKIKAKHHESTLVWEGSLVKTILTNGIQNGEVKAIAEKDMDSLVFLLLSALHGIKREMRMERHTRNIDSTTGQLTRLFIHGLKK